MKGAKRLTLALFLILAALGYCEEQQQQLELKADWCTDAVDTAEPEGAAYCDHLYRLAYGEEP